MTTAYDAAEKIMALVDEYPSEPFSWERRQMLIRLATVIVQHTNQIDDELDESFNLGVDEGRSQVTQELEDEYGSRIEELEDKLQDAKDEEKKIYEEGYQDGWESARVEGGFV